MLLQFSPVSFHPQMATPVGRRECGRIEMSFLGNITAKVSEEQRRKEGREAERGRGREGMNQVQNV